jgi:Domain of unknown function (DUF4350)
MPDFKKLIRQYWQFVFLAVVAIVLFTVVSATGGDPRQPGSTYSIVPNGYGAWYQMMVDRGVRIDRSKQDFSQFVDNPANETGTTLLQVNSKIEELQLDTEQQEWVKQGNTLAILGVAAPAWDIPFESDLASPQGKVRIETTRRFRAERGFGLALNTPSTDILSDSAGNAITQFELGKGRIIVATTPHLAANAYQDFRPNYELLAKLVTADRQRIVVDEYIHGYRDRKSTAKSKTGDVFAYLTRTPWIIVLLNLVLGLLVLIWQQNRRFGKIIIPKQPEIENSEAYIRALGGVLQQANSSEFVLQNIGKANQLIWQQKLGLGGDRLVSADTLINAWKTKTQLPTDDLRSVLQLAAGEQRLAPAELNEWLKKVQSIGGKLDI